MPMPGNLPKLPQRPQIVHHEQQVQPHVEHETRMRKLFAHRELPPQPPVEHEPAYEAPQSYTPPAVEMVREPQFPQTYTPPQDVGGPEIELIEQQYLSLQLLIEGILPDGQYRDASLEAFEVSRQFAVAAVSQR